MKNRANQASRRNFLRGVGAYMALPALESLQAQSVIAGGSDARLATTASGAPLRAAFIFFPNGAHQENWFPAEGAHLGKTMEPLESLKDSVQILGGLDHQNAMPGHDGGGDHARGTATFLTGARARKTDSANIHLGASVDQLIAQRVGQQTRFASLELSCDAVRKSGSCDSGYSCAYQYNISWRTPTLPAASETNPRLVFERLFGSGAPKDRRRNLEMRRQTQRSLLDAVIGDARDLKKDLSSADHGKLDEYLTGVREIEQRIERAERFGDLPVPEMQSPEGTPEDYGKHMDLMYDLMAVAFETDSTRVSSFMLAHDGSNRSFKQIGVPDGHHDCSHHGNRKVKLDKIAKIDRYYMDHFARFLKRLESKKDLDGRSVLDNSMIVYGGGNADGNKHSHDNLPVILAGGGGGTLSAGRYAKMGGVPMSNLFLSMATRMGATDVVEIGDSTGPLKNL